MIVETPDGEVEFPDSMSEDAIKGVLRKKYGGGAKPTSTEKAAPPDPTGGAYTYDKGGGWQAALHNLAVGSNNATRVLSDAYTFGGLDAAQGQMPGSPSAKDLRAQTDASREAVGPYAAAGLDAVGRLANPLSRVGGMGPLGLAASGAGQQAASAALHGEDPEKIAEQAVVGGVTGGAIGTGGKYLATPTFYPMRPRILHRWWRRALLRTWGLVR